MPARPRQLATERPGAALACVPPEAAESHGAAPLGAQARAHEAGQFTDVVGGSSWSIRAAPLPQGGPQRSCLRFLQDLFSVLVSGT